MKSRAAYLASLSPALRARQARLMLELDDAAAQPYQPRASTCIAAPGPDDAAIIERERHYADQRARRRMDAGE